MSDELGVFAWVKLPEQPTLQTRLEADFRAVFAPWRPHKLKGTVCPPEPVEHDIYKPLVRLVSIDMAEGRWTLYAKGPALAPPGVTYQVVSGPLSEAKSWIHSGAGKAWRMDAVVVALVTLSSCYEPMP